MGQGVATQGLEAPLRQEKPAEELWDRVWRTKWLPKSKCVSRRAQEFDLEHT